MMEGEKTMKRGFTLMELIVVMAILAILSVMVMGSYRATQRKKNDLKRKSDLTQLGKALELYNNDLGVYPVSGTGLNAGKIMGCGAGGLAVCEWGKTVFSNTTTNIVYMAKMPADPLGRQKYYYDSDGTYYKLYASLENLDDPAIVVGGYAGTNCCIGLCTTASCNFGVASTNVSP
jgi:prepilin-type N-terminal cleavage/methylation domain-containing protein